MTAGVVEPAGREPADRREPTDRREPADRREQGSITPLVIGMVLCLLILGVGVIAAGSAVLARRNLQSACDGAVAAVAGSVTPEQLMSASAGAWDQQLTSYLARRMPGAAAVSGASATAVVARCENDSRISSAPCSARRRCASRSSRSDRSTAPDARPGPTVLVETAPRPPHARLPCRRCTTGVRPASRRTNRT